MPKRSEEDYNLSSHGEGMRYRWEPYTRAEVDVLAKSLGNPEDPPARRIDPRVPRLIATLKLGYADEE